MDWIKKLQKMWNENRSYKKLEWIEFDEKGIRGIKNIKIEFKYPITAMAGANGVGKTTILQTIACLFHNDDKTYRPYRLSNAKHQPPYYRFSDFFVFTRDEENFKKGIKIKYFFDGKVYNIKRDNRWSKYERRPKRYVDYIGVSRVLPSYEFSTFKNTFKGNYKISNKKKLDDDTKSKISNILNNPLNDIEEISSKKISNFKLNNVKTQDGLKYSNFNMGAGEEVAISLISRISSLKENSLILIEEIELGLHPLAQKRLINELMKIAYKKKLQIIFTTHSPFIFDNLPLEARILLKKIDQNIDIFYNASKNLAFIELSGDSINKLTIYVEDDIAKNILEHLLSSEITKRIKIVDVGDKRNVIKMLSAHIHNPSLGKSLAVLDGDVKEKDIRNACKDFCRKGLEQTKEYIEKYILQLPGELAPEKYIFEKIKENKEFQKYIDDSSDFEHFIKMLNLEDHHSLFFEISKFLNKTEDGVKHQIIDYFTKTYKDEFREIREKINKELV
jgi:predicted ATPase